MVCLISLDLGIIPFVGLDTFPHTTAQVMKEGFTETLPLEIFWTIIQENHAQMINKVKMLTPENSVKFPKKVAGDIQKASQAMKVKVREKQRSQSFERSQPKFHKKVAGDIQKASQAMKVRVHEKQRSQSFERSQTKFHKKVADDSEG